MRTFALATLMSAAVTVACFAQGHVDHSTWDALLHAHVRNGQVDYQALLASRGPLEGYLAMLADANVGSLNTPDDRLAFWINAYNASVVKAVLDHYPVVSVKKIPGFFDRVRYKVAGKMLTLNEMEAQARLLRDWRVHFALVCASSSCPILRSEAYLPERLEAQLRDQATHFLGDPSRGMRAEGSTLLVSRIFEWYAPDFGLHKPMGGFGRPSPGEFIQVLADYLDPKFAERLRQQARHLDFMDYDWTLNDSARGGYRK